MKIGKTLFQFVLSWLLLGLAFLCVQGYTRTLDVELDKPQLADAVLSGRDVTISWSYVPFSSSYQIYRRIPGGVWNPIGEATASQQSYTDIGVTRNDYEYSVVARNISVIGVIYSDFSDPMPVQG